MSNSVYQINKGINKPIEFRGLKAQYIAYLAIGLVSLLILFAILYITGVNIFICLTLILSSGGFLFSWVYRLSHKYGQYGLMKKAAQRYMPDYIKCNSSKLFVSLAADKKNG